MTTLTPNLSLILYDSSGDQAATFATWRAAIDGPASTSNFYRIDTAYGTQASQITSLQATRGAIRVNSIFQSANFYSVTGITSITTYTTGMTIILSVDIDSSGTVTLDINSLGIKSVMKTDSSGTPVNLTGSDLNAGRYYLFMYDGTRWMWVSANSADQINVDGTAGNVLTVNTDNTILGTLTQSLLISQTVNSATAKTTLADADLLGLVDSAASNVLKKITWANIATAIGVKLGTVINALTGKTTPVDADEFVLGDSAASYLSKKLTFANLKLTIIGYLMAGQPDGAMWNGMISTSVTSNDITVSLKTKAGANPSVSDSVYIMINGTLRACTATLSKTLVDGTNWFNSGASELGTKEIDYFAYIIWNTTPATDIVDIGFSRIPYGTVYSDFSGTTTNEKYLAFANASTPTSTDDVVVVGRFAATLSLTGTGFLWTIPTPTSSNLIQHPIYETRDLNFNLTGSGFTIGNGVVTAVYKRIGTLVTGHLEFVLGNSGSAITGDFLFTPPVTQGVYGAVSVPVGVNRLLSGGSGYAGVVLAASTTSFRVAVYVSSATYLTAAVLSSIVPATWTNNDLVEFPFEYIGA